MHGQHRPASTTSEDDVKGRSDTTNEPSSTTLNPDRCVWWSVPWEFNRAIYHTSNDREADVIIDRLEQKYGGHRAEEVYRRVCEKYGTNPAAGTCVTDS